MKNNIGAFIWAFLAAAVVALIIYVAEQQPKPENPLTVHVGGTMAPVVTELAKLYEEETGQKVEVNSAGSGELLAYIAGQKKGDVYICHDPFIDILMQKWKLGVDGWLLAELTPGIVVQKGNPKGIKDLKDLTREDVRLILTDYQLSSLGRMLGTIFAKAGIDLVELDKQKKIVTNKSGGYTANYVKMRNADAGMVWKAVWKLRNDALDFVPITPYLPVPQVDAVTSATGKAYYLTPMRVTVATLKCAYQPKEAKKFAEFIASPRVGKILEEYGFTMSGNMKLYEKGKALSDVPGPIAMIDQGPVLKMMACAGMRKPLDEIVEAFKTKTGTSVDLDYGGSGVILSRAVASATADIFMPADQWYVDRLKEKHPELVVSETAVGDFVPVIITAKGNPHGIKTLKDLLREEIRVGIGTPKTCAIGRLTDKMLKKNGIDPAAMNAKESTTVNELGVWVKMKNVDAAIAWEAIGRNLGEDAHIVHIPPEDMVTSTIIVTMLNTSNNKPQAEQFIEFLSGAESRKILEKFGYKPAAR